MKSPIALAVLLLLGVSACGRQEPAAPPPASPAQAEANAPPAEPPPAPATARPAGTVDVCALLPRAEAEAILGPLLRDPLADAEGLPMGSCDYVGQTGVGFTLLAYPAAEFAAMRGTATAAQAPPGVAGDSYVASGTIFIQPPGKPYFIAITRRGPDDQGDKAALAAAQKLRF